MFLLHRGDRVINANHMGTRSPLSVLGLLLTAPVLQLGASAAWKMTSGSWKLCNGPQNKGMEIVGIDVGNTFVSF